MALLRNSNSYRNILFLEVGPYNFLKEEQFFSDNFIFIVWVR